MSEIEQKALALLNECGWGGAHLKRTWNPRYEALCRAIEQHEADKAHIAALEAALSWALIQLGSETGYNMESPIWHAYDRARSVLNGEK